MRETSPRGWPRWPARLTTPPSVVLFDHGTRLRGPVANEREPAAGCVLSADPRGDGIRHELVARVRQEIAAGTYDTEEKWLLAESALLRRIENRA
jgi:hypothetical protein